MIFHKTQNPETATPGEVELLPHLKSQKTKASWLRKKRFTGSWRKTVTWGIYLVSAVLVANISLLITAARAPKDEELSGTLYSGSCSRSKTITDWAELAINICSTLLLAASNNCGQITSAPSREDADKAHAKDQWMEIGVPSLRNLRFIPKKRVALWTVLLLSSMPLHLIYNSAIFSKLAVNKEIGFVVAEDFLDGAPWNHTRFDNTGNALLEQLRADVTELTKLDTDQCLEAYAKTNLISAYRNFLIVTVPFNESLTGSAIASIPINPTAKGPRDSPDLPWPCLYGYWPAQCAYKENPYDCLFHDLFGPPWTIVWKVTPQSQISIADYPSWAQGSSFGAYGATVFNSTVQYCLAQAVDELCMVQVNIPILIIVILANVVKLCCLVEGRRSKAKPLVTVGDAISSYLSHPDQYSRDIGPIAKHQVKASRLPSISNDVGYAMQNSQRPRWIQGAGKKNWSLGILICIAAWAYGVVLLAGSIGGTAVAPALAKGLGTLDVNLRIDLPSTSRISNVLLSNTPQVVISFIYVYYNRIFTAMFLAHEYTSFARTRKPLRVSNPSGHQKSTYTLQIPLKFILPMMGSMALLHWFVSRGMFAVSLVVHDEYGNIDAESGKTICLFSPLGVFLAVLISGLMIVVLIIVSFFKLTPWIPVATPNSFAIAAACHNPNGAEEQLLPLKYGVMVGEELDENGKFRIGFSSKSVMFETDDSYPMDVLDREGSTQKDATATNAAVLREDENQGMLSPETSRRGDD